MAQVIENNLKAIEITTDDLKFWHFPRISAKCNNSGQTAICHFSSAWKIESENYVGTVVRIQKMKEGWLGVIKQADIDQKISFELVRKRYFRSNVKIIL